MQKNTAELDCKQQSQIPSCQCKAIPSKK